jgi:peptide/nickel transport system permease protein
MKLRRKFGLTAGFAGFLVFLSLFAEFLSSNAPSTQNLEQFYHPPTRIHFFDNNGKFHVWPFIYRTELTQPLDIIYREDAAAPYPLEFFFRGYRYNLLGLIPLDLHLAGRSQAPFYYPLGTDELGRDVLSRSLSGARTSLLVVVLGMAFYAAFGMTIGSAAGLLGGWRDAVLMRFSEFVLALPALYLVLGLRALLPMSIPFWQTLFLTVGTIAAIAWPPMARGIRGLIVQLRTSAYVEAAHSLGGSRIHIFLRHMLPTLIPFALSQTVVAAPVFLLGEVTLSFLNVGFRDSAVSWGAMLRSLKDTRTLTDFWWNLLPLFLVFWTLLLLHSIGRRMQIREPEDHVMRL